MSPTIRVDEDVYKKLQHAAEPFVDTPNTVLRRLLGLEGTRMPDTVEPDGADLPDQGVSVSESVPRTSASVDPKERQRRAARKGRKQRAKRGRITPGSLLPEDRYEVPLLRALVDRGGDAPARDVVEAVGEMLNGALTDMDRQTLASGGIRWQSRVQFVRLRLVERGLLLKGSARGVWAISDMGRKHLDAQGGER